MALIDSCGGPSKALLGQIAQDKANSSPLGSTVLSSSQIFLTVVHLKRIVFVFPSTNDVTFRAFPVRLSVRTLSFRNCFGLVFTSESGGEFFLGGGVGGESGCGCNVESLPS